MIDTFSRLWCDISILRFFFSVLNAVRLLLYSNKIMMVFSLFESILGIKRYSFLGFSYNHWYNKWIKSWFLPTFSKPSFFYWLGWATRYRRSLGRCATFACFGDTLLEISSLALKKRSTLRRLLWRLFSSIDNFWGVDLEQVYCFENFALLMLGFWAPLAFHNCLGIQFSDGIIIIISINVKELLSSVVRDGWMIDSNIRCVTQGGALNRLRFCT